MQVYKIKSSAHRAAKAAGLSKEQYEIVEVEDGFSFQEIVKLKKKEPTRSKNADAAAKKPKKEQPKHDAESLAAVGLDPEAPVAGDFTHCPECKIHLSNGVSFDDGSGFEVNGKREGHESHRYMCLGCNAEFGPRLPKRKPAPEPVVEAPKEKRPAAPVLHKSEIESPTKTVWDVAEEMNKAAPARRKDVIAECVKRGIAFNTARTQYQLWFRAQRA